MPLKRTPPPSPASPAASTLELPENRPALVRSTSATLAPTQANTLRVPLVENQLHASSSAPNLPGLSRKTKRRCLGAKVIDNDIDDVDTLSSFMEEMKQMFLDFKSEQEKSNNTICAAVEEVRSAVNFLAEKYDLLQARVEKLETQRKSDILYTKSLEDKLDNFERQSRSTCLEIRNIPVPATESKSSLLDTFLKTSKVLNAPVQPGDVKDIFRIQAKDHGSRTIIVDLTSVLQKEKIIHMFRQFNKGSSRLSTEHLHIGGPARPVFISENLSSKMKKLFFLARETAKQNDFQFCWVSHGKIFLRKREKGPLIRVVDESDLSKAKLLE